MDWHHVGTTGYSQSRGYQVYTVYTSNGVLCGSNFRVGFGNVYAQNVDSEKAELWDVLEGIIGSIEIV